MVVGWTEIFLELDWIYLYRIRFAGSFEFTTKLFGWVLRVLKFWFVLKFAVDIIGSYLLNSV